VIRLGFEDGIHFCYEEGPRFKAKSFKQEENGSLWVEGGKILRTPLDLKFEGRIDREEDLSFNLSPSEMICTSKSGEEVTLKFDDEVEGDLRVLVDVSMYTPFPSRRTTKFRSQNA
jgi:hypothetical protein